MASENSITEPSCVMEYLSQKRVRVWNYVVNGNYSFIDKSQVLDRTIRYIWLFYRQYSGIIRGPTGDYQPMTNLSMRGLSPLSASGLKGY